MLHRPLHTWEKRKENYIYLLYIFLIMGIDSIRDAVLLLKIPLPFLLKRGGGGTKKLQDDIIWRQTSEKITLQFHCPEST